MQTLHFPPSSDGVPPGILSDSVIDVHFFHAWPAARQAAESPHLAALLAPHLAVPAACVRIERDAHGKPHVQDAALQFNLSHSGDAALLAIARNVALGVDLEQLGRRERPVLALAQRFFDPAEASALAALPPQRQQSAFLELWCCKEAVLKALGRGLGYGLERVVFQLDDTGAVQHLLRLGDGAASPWQVVQLRPAPGYVGALAWCGAALQVRVGRARPLV